MRERRKEEEGNGRREKGERETELKEATSL